MNRYQIANEQVTASILDDEAVLVHLETTHYYNLNASGTLIWTLLQAGPTTLEQAVEAVAQAYDLNAANVSQDVQRLLDELVAEGLISLSR